MNQSQRYLALKQKVTRLEQALKDLKVEAGDITEAELEPLLRVEEVAAYFRISPKTVYDMARDKRIPCVRIGAALRFRMSEIQDFRCTNAPS